MGTVKGPFLNTSSLETQGRHGSQVAELTRPSSKGTCTPGQAQSQKYELTSGVLPPHQVPNSQLILTSHRPGETHSDSDKHDDHPLMP